MVCVNKKCYFYGDLKKKKVLKALKTNCRLFDEKYLKDCHVKKIQRDYSGFFIPIW